MFVFHQEHYVAISLFLSLSLFVSVFFLYPDDFRVLLIYYFFLVPSNITKSCGPGPMFDGFGSTPILLLLKIPRTRIHSLGLQNIFRNSGGMYIYGQSKSGVWSHWVLPCCSWISFRVISGRHPEEHCIFREMSGAGVLTPVLRRRHCRLPDLSHRGNYYITRTNRPYKRFK